MAKKNGSSTKKVALGIGIAAATAAAAAGAYWLYGSKDAGKHRKQVRGWMLKARGEVMDAVEKLKDVDKETYLGIVDKVMKGYTSAKGISRAEVSDLAEELKKSWEHMHKGSGRKKSRPKKK